MKREQHIKCKRKHVFFARVLSSLKFSVFFFPVSSLLHSIFFAYIMAINFVDKFQIVDLFFVPLDIILCDFAFFFFFYFAVRSFCSFDQIIYFISNNQR